ncbi:LysR family transcriptional regulator [Erythrobacter mangrovi]|uniref:LysR family transcriptional regulator n=1 Tax=Erythrobacter mangrovi TaxID=2739433 RepID=A0A7D3XIX5_9SPHN|nr:LysR family transcriptional regulator [Erythrobacter mangrovi]QKG72493.1 LysR family transcriptional regulator [Erythrobacter mangrovi]
MRLSWDDVAVLLAVLRTGTTGRAAEFLGCSQPTVVRKVAALEAAIGLTLFDRTVQGLRPTEAALALAPYAESLETAACEFETEAASLRGETSQLIRLTLLDHYELLLVPILKEYRKIWPNVQVELLASDRVFDLARGEADIAIRGRATSDHDAVVCRRLPDCSFSVYAPADMDMQDRPRTWDDVARHRIGIPERPLAQLPVYENLAKLAQEGKGSVRCSNYNALRSAIISGNALAALPVTIGRTDPSLVECLPPPPEFDVAIYLLGRRAALRRPYVRMLFDSIDEYFRTNPTVLTGRNATRN